MTILISGAKVIDDSSPHHLDTVDIFIENGVITAIGQVLHQTAETTIVAEGLHVSNGFCDLFADYSEPGFEHKETIATGLASAAAGGFTHVAIVPNTQPTVNSKSIVQYLLTQSANHPVTLLPLGAISHNIEGKNLAEMLDMQANGAVAFTDGWKPIQNANLMLKALEYVKAFDGTLIQIPMDAALSAGGLMHEGTESTQLGMPGIPTLAETILLHRDIELLRYTKSRLHVTGVSSAESVEMIRKAKAEGLNITCSVTPYHLVLNDEALGSYDSVYKVMPPIRSEKDRLSLVAGLKDGTIDAIASHHRAQEWDAKAKEFEYAAEGMNIQELAFAIVYNSLKNDLTLEQIIKAFSTAPARILGVQNTGINIGAASSLTLFSTTQQTNKNTLKSLAVNNPFLNKNLTGAVVGIVNGNKTSLNN